MNIQKCMSRLMAAVSLLFAVGASAGDYSFANAEGGDATDAANWLNTSVPADSDETARVAFTNLTQGSTATLADTGHAWKELRVANGTVAGGSLSLTNGIKAALKNGEATIASALSGDAVHYVHGAKVHLAANQTNDVAVGVRNGSLVLDGALTSASSLHLDGNGVVEVAQDQTVGTLSGDCRGGRLQIDSGKTLTLAGGEAPAATEFGGNLRGSGTMVKQGAQYELTLTSDTTTNHPFSGAIDIAAGRLALSDGKPRTGSVTPTMYWSFDDPASPGKADAGSVDLSAWVYDSTNSSGGYFTGVTTNISSLGVSGSGIRPDGAVFMGKNSNLWPQSNEAFSLFCWAKILQETEGSVQLMILGERDGNNGQVVVRVESDGGLAIYKSYLMNSGDKVVTVNADTDYRDGAWHFYGVTFDGTTVRAYVDGHLAGSGTATFNLKAGWCHFDIGLNGARGKVGSSGCDIWMDEVAIYKGTVLTDTQIAQCHQAFRSCPENALETVEMPDPVAWYRFDDATAVGKDSSGNECNLTGVYKEGSSMASSNQKYWPIVVSGSPISGGMYSPDGHRWLSYGGAEGGNLPDAIPTGTSPISVSLWVNLGSSMPRILSSTGYDLVLFQLGNCDDSKCHRIGVVHKDDSFRFGFATARGWTRIDGTDCFVTAEDAESWHHLSYVSTGSAVSFYVDGKLQGAYSGGVDIPQDGILAIGAGVGSYEASAQSTQLFKGNLDEVKIYDEALTPEQVAADYRSELPRTGNVIDPAATVSIATGAILAVDGVEQTLESVPSGTGTIQLKRGATLTLSPSGTETLSADATGYGTLRISGGGKVTLAGAVGADVTVVVSNATVSAASELGGSLEIESGAMLKMSDTLSVAGTVTLKPGFSVDAADAPSGWCALIQAGEIVLDDGVDLNSIRFVNKPSGRGVLKLEDGTLKAKLVDGLTIVFR